MTEIKQYQGTARGRTLSLVLLASGAFAFGTSGFVIAGVLPSIAASFDIPITQASLLITVYAVVFAVGAPFVSIVTARVPRTVLIASGLALGTVGTTLAGLVPTFELMMAARVLAALGAAAFVPAATSAAAAIAQPGKQGRAVALVTGGFTAATALGAPLGTVIGSIGSWHWSLYFVGIIGALVFASIVVVLRGVPAAETMTVRERFAPLASGRIALVMVATLLLVAGQYSAYTFFGAVQDRATGGSGTILAVLLFVYGVSATVGNLVAGVLADRFGNRRVLEISLVILIADFLVMPIAGAQLWSAIICIAVWGFSAWAALLAIQHRIVGISSSAIAWNTSATFFGIALSGPVGSLAISTVGAHSLTLVGAGVLVLAVVSGMLSHRLVTRESKKSAIRAGESTTEDTEMEPAPGDTRNRIG